MIGWLRKAVPVVGSVYFRGTWPPRAEEFGFLEDHGIVVQREEKAASDSVIWALKLAHPEWGEATLVCQRPAPMPSPTFFDWDPGLTPGEAEAMKACGTSVQVMASSRRGHLLKDRKNALRYLMAAMGTDGVGAVDHVSLRCWSRGALEAETAHPADVDVESLYSLHAVRMEEGLWLHTHGLAEIGLFDFDILNPSPSLLDSGGDMIRALAFAVLEGSLKPRGQAALFSHGGPIRAVPVADFEDGASPAHRALREDPEGDHRENRAVLCDPAGGILGRFRSRPRPSAHLMKHVEDGSLTHYSSEASELMGERARNTYPLFRQTLEELKPHKFPVVVKLGYEIDGGGGREFLWFEVHEAGEEEMDATLANQPHAISRMSHGDRARHPVSRLADWQILSPRGVISPRQTLALRALRERPHDDAGEPAGR